MLKELTRGLWITAKSIFEKPVTIQYPEEKREVRPRFQAAAHSEQPMHFSKPLSYRLSS